MAAYVWQIISLPFEILLFHYWAGDPTQDVSFWGDSGLVTRGLAQISFLLRICGAGPKAYPSKHVQKGLAKLGPPPQNSPSLDPRPFYWLLPCGGQTCVVLKSSHDILVEVILKFKNVFKILIFFLSSLNLLILWYMNACMVEAIPSEKQRYPGFSISQEEVSWNGKHFSSWYC